MKINKILMPKQISDLPISVSIIDSGFSHIPKYAKIYGYNNIINHEHGDKVLSVFTALDKYYPIPNLTLNLVSYNPNTEYRGLIKALKLLPHSDILSISIAWASHNDQIKNLLFEKADKICVPYTKGSDNPFPSEYEGVITCSYNDNYYADYSINPVIEYKGNSFAVPAIARLLASRINIENNLSGKSVLELFKYYNDLSYSTTDLNKGVKLLSCPFCNKKLRSKYYTPLKEFPERCPYCGLRLK